MDLWRQKKIFSKYGYKMLFIEKNYVMIVRSFSVFKDEVDNNWGKIIYIHSYRNILEQYCIQKRKTEQAVKDMKKNKMAHLE